MASSMCGGDQVRSKKIRVSCLQSGMVEGMSWSGAAWVLQVLESYISLGETWTPTCTVKYSCRKWSPPSRPVLQGSVPAWQWPQTPPKTTSALLKRLGLKVMNRPSMSPELNPIELLWGIIKWRWPWCSRYRRRKWTRRYEFKSWTILIAFHIALIPLGKVWIQLFSLQLWVNSRTD